MTKLPLLYGLDVITNPILHEISHETFGLLDFLILGVRLTFGLLDTSYYNSTVEGKKANLIAQKDEIPRNYEFRYMKLILQNWVMLHRHTCKIFKMFCWATAYLYPGTVKITNVHYGYNIFKTISLCHFWWSVLCKNEEKTSGRCQLLKNVTNPSPKHFYMYIIGYRCWFPDNSAQDNSALDNSARTIRRDNSSLTIRRKIRY